MESLTACDSAFSAACWRNGQMCAVAENKVDCVTKAYSIISCNAYGHIALYNVISFTPLLRYCAGVVCDKCVAVNGLLVAFFVEVGYGLLPLRTRRDRKLVRQIRYRLHGNAARHNKRRKRTGCKLFPKSSFHYIFPPFRKRLCAHSARGICFVADVTSMDICAGWPPWDNTESVVGLSVYTYFHFITLGEEIQQFCRKKAESHLEGIRSLHDTVRRQDAVDIETALHRSVHFGIKENRNPETTVCSLNFYYIPFSNS